MSADAALSAGRAAAEARMTGDTCRITFIDEQNEAWDPDKAKYVNPTVTAYEGKCRMPARGSSASTTSAGPESWNVGEFPLDLPFTAETEALRSGMEVEWLSSAHNPALVGRKFTLSEPLLASQATALRWKVKAAV